MTVRPEWRFSSAMINTTLGLAANSDAPVKPSRNRKTEIVFITEPWTAKRQESNFLSGFGVPQELDLGKSPRVICFQCLE